MFSWYEPKRKENWRLRGVDFADVIGIFDDPHIAESVDPRKDYGEERIQAVGQTEGIWYFVVYTWRDGARHIITA